MSFADKLVPVLVIMLFLYMHYAYAVELCLLKITSFVKKIIYLVGINVCVLPVVIHYFVTMFMTSGNVPTCYRFGLVEVEALNRLDPSDTKIDRILEQFCYYRGIQTYTRKYNRIRYCMKCKHVKPDRTHHCSTCKVCVLKMDHHCPWIDNCVHFRNYKVFFLLLIHTIIYCTYYVGTCAEYVFEFFLFKDLVYRDLIYIVGCALALLTGIAVTALFGFHVALMIRNQTTLEAMSEPTFVENCSFDLGKEENFLEVFGYNCCLWWLPCHSSLGNGVHFPIRYN